MQAINPDFIELAILAEDGSILLDEGGFLDRTSPLIRAQLVEIAHSQPDRASFELVERGPGEFFPVALAPLATGKDWLDPLLPPDITSSGRGIVACRLSDQATCRRLEAFGNAFGFPPAVTRTLVAFYQHCDLRLAAKATGISFNTARDYIQHARTAIWAPNLPRLITWAAIGSLAADSIGESDQAAGELFLLSERQRRLASLIADGASRTEAAREIGISVALAKKELATVFAATGVTSASGLARLFAELRALAIVTREIRQQEPYPPPFSRTIRIATSDGRQIVASDYGPASGKPVLVLHNTMNCRGVDRALVEALQNHGFRPISPDRPGYGDTTPVASRAEGHDYLRACVDDIIELCAAMNWATVSVIAHGPVHIVLALLERAPDLVDRAVVDAPEPDSAYGASAQGMIPSLKRQFARRPWAVASIVRILTTLASHTRVATLMQEWTANSPADSRAMADPALLMDFYRKLIPFRRGKIDGLVREQVFQATMGRPQAGAGTDKMVLLIGQTDFMHDADENRGYWQSVLPAASIVLLPEAGRFISYSHPEKLVAELLRR